MKNAVIPYAFGLTFAAIILLMAVPAMQNPPVKAADKLGGR
jgi:hypothetical protein